MSLLRTLARNVTVEPIFFLFLVGAVMYWTITSAALYYKVCRQNFRHLYNVDCQRLWENPKIETKVQQLTAYWQLYIALAYVFPLLIVGPTWGAFGDRFGRKVTIMFGLTGFILSALIHLAEFVYADTMSLVWLPLTGLLLACTGFIGTIFTSVYAYVADRVNDRLSLTARCLSLIMYLFVVFLALVVLFTVLQLTDDFAYIAGGYSSSFLLSRISINSAMIFPQILWTISFLLTFVLLKQEDPRQTRKNAEDYGTAAEVVQQPFLPAPKRDTVSDRTTAIGYSYSYKRERHHSERVVDDRQKAHDHDTVALFPQLLKHAKTAMTVKTNVATSGDVLCKVEDCCYKDTNSMLSNKNGDSLRNRPFTCKCSESKQPIRKHKSGCIEQIAVEDHDNVIRATAKLLVSSVRAIVRPRKGRFRCYIWVTFLSFFWMNTTHMGMGQAFSLFVFHPPISWSPSELGAFSGFEHAMRLLGSLLNIVMLKVYGSHESTVIIISNFSMMVRLLVLGTSQTWLGVYASGVIGCASSLIFPCTKSLICQFIGPGEIGRVYALFQLAMDAGYLFAVTVFNVIYAETVGVFPGFLFIFSAAIALIATVPMVWLRWDYDRFRCGVGPVLYQPVKLELESPEMSDA